MNLYMCLQFCVMHIYRQYQLICCWSIIPVVQFLVIPESGWCRSWKLVSSRCWMKHKWFPPNPSWSRNSAFCKSAKKLWAWRALPSATPCSRCRSPSCLCVLSLQSNLFCRSICVSKTVGCQLDSRKMLIFSPPQTSPAILFTRQCCCRFWVHWFGAQ